MNLCGNTYGVCLVLSGLVNKVCRDLLLSANDNLDVLKFAIRSSLNVLSLFSPAQESRENNLF